MDSSPKTFVVSHGELPSRFRQMDGYCVKTSSGTSRIHFPKVSRIDAPNLMSMCSCSARSRIITMMLRQSRNSPHVLKLTNELAKAVLNMTVRERERRAKVNGHLFRYRRDAINDQS